MRIIRFLHPPGAVLQYHMDWSAWLAGDTIISSTWHAMPLQATEHVTLSQETWAETVTAVLVTGGSPSEAPLPAEVWRPTCLLTNDIVTSSGRESARDAAREGIPCIQLFLQE